MSLDDLMVKEEALLKASLEGEIDRVNALLSEGVNPNCKDGSGRGPLLSFYPEVINSLLEYGAKPNLQYNENGHSVLSGLCYANSIFRELATNQMECIRLLLNAGADIEKGYELSKETPLHHATASMGKENVEVLNLLLENNANPNAKTKYGVISDNFYLGARTRGETPLHRAAAFCDIDTVSLLQEFGADNMVLDDNGEPPLSWACWYRRPKTLIEMLR